MALEYSLPTSFGTFTSRTEATYLDSFRLRQSPRRLSPELSNQASSIFSNEGYIKWRGRSELNWSWKASTSQGRFVIRMAFVSRY